MTKIESPLSSVSKITISQTGILFVADWKGSQIMAFALPDGGPAPLTPPPPFNIKDLESRVYAKFELNPAFGPIALEDIAVRPGTYEVYVALSVGPEKMPLLITAAPDGEIEEINLSVLPSSVVSLNDLPESEQLMFEPEPILSYTVTDMKWRAEADSPGGRLYVAGLSNLYFSSTLRIFDYPFTGVGQTRTVEVYHAGHQQWESRAPIRAFDFLDLEIATRWDPVTGEPDMESAQKEPCLVAALLCTPLAVVPLSRIKNAEEKGHIVGKTIAEIGVGGTPVGLIPFTRAGMAELQIPDSEAILVVNRFMQSLQIPVPSIQKATNASPQGVTRPIPNGEVIQFDGQKAGDRQGMQDMLMDTVHRIALMPNYSPKGGVAMSQFIALRRDLRTGAAQLLSYPNIQMNRLTDMVVEEYWWKSYQFNFGYPFDRFMVQSQNMSLSTEGYPESIRPAYPSGGSK